MAGGAQRPGSTITGINVTPLVDITLVLLIIFMVTAKLIANPKAMSVDLPKAASGGDVQEIFSVVLLAGGGAQVDGKAFPDDDHVLEAARTARKKHDDLRAVIKADGAVPHSRVMHVLDQLKLAGVAKIGFGVTPTPVTSASARPLP
ncbi:Biopolymer transport protein ExbD/TolR [Minicystis rosea]|nr:Biopolymer transport protein ExbD/TolR [Minicystis rosea]